MIRLKEAICVKRRSKGEKCKVEANLDPRRGKTKKWYEMRTSFYFLFFIFYFLTYQDMVCPKWLFLIFFLLFLILNMACLLHQNPPSTQSFTRSL